MNELKIKGREVRKALASKYQQLVQKASKIAILVPDFSPYSGNGRVADVQAEELIRKGKRVTIFSLRAGMRPESAELKVIGMPKNLLLGRIYSILFPLDIIKIARWLPTFKDYDLIISHFYPMNWLAYLAKKLYKVKYIYWYHGIVTPPSLYPHLYERLNVWFDIFSTKLTVKNVDLAVSVSRSAAKEFKTYTGLDSEVIYNKPDLRKFHKGLDGSTLRKKLNLGSAPVILNVGLLSPVKGAHLLIRAFQIIKREIPEAILIFVGKPNFTYYFKQLKRMSDDSVIFAGFVPDEELPQYYAMCDVYATCSLWEAHNNPILEAQACGKPVIAFDFDWAREEVDENGILVEKGNVEKFAEACIKKLKEVRPDLKLGGRR
jgi:1,2-diacylglycerol 3-alpha-glucosyltransferase